MKLCMRESAPTESLYCRPCAIAALNPDAREEVHALFPKIGTHGFSPERAREMPDSRQQTANEICKVATAQR